VFSVPSKQCSFITKNPVVIRYIVPLYTISIRYSTEVSAFNAINIPGMKKAEAVKGSC